MNESWIAQLSSCAAAQARKAFSFELNASAGGGYNRKVTHLFGVVARPFATADLLHFERDDQQVAVVAAFTRVGIEQPQDARVDVRFFLEFAQSGRGDRLACLSEPHRETPLALVGLALTFDKQHLAVLVEHNGGRDGQGVLVENGFARGANDARTAIHNARLYLLATPRTVVWFLRHRSLLQRRVSSFLSKTTRP